MSSPTAAAAAANHDDAPNLQMPIGHPAGQHIHQPPAKPKFEPDEMHVALFKAIAGLKDGTPPNVASVGLKGTGAAMLIVYMGEEIGEKKLKKLGTKDVQDWVLAFKRQNPRVWICFQRGAIVQLVHALVNDHTRAAKPSTEWQREVGEVLRSEAAASEE